MSIFDLDILNSTFLFLSLSFKVFSGLRDESSDGIVFISQVSDRSCP
jgi:hypothetical protein